MITTMEYLRLDTSSYFQSDFTRREEQLILPLLQETHREGIILLSNTHTDPRTIPADLLAQTALMIHPNSGYDNFDPAWVIEQSFPIIVGHEIRAAAVTEYILASLFERFTPVPTHKTWDQTRQWNRQLLSEQNVLILGAGHIGSQLEKTLSSLCQSVQVFDPFLNRLQLDLNKVNIVLLAAGLNPTSRHLVDQAFLAECAPGVTLINAARGGLVKTDDLINHLKNDKEAFAFLDVFEKEPFALESISSLENIRLSSHIAGVFSALEEKMLNFEQKVIKDFLTLGQDFTKVYEKQWLQKKWHRGFLI